MRNDAYCKIAIIGMVKIKMFDMFVKTLGDARRVLDLKKNLISLSTLNSKRYK